MLFEADKIWILCSKLGDVWLAAGDWQLTADWIAILCTASSVNKVTRLEEVSFYSFIFSDKLGTAFSIPYISGFWSPEHQLGSTALQSCWKACFELKHANLNLDLAMWKMLIVFLGATYLTSALMKITFAMNIKHKNMPFKLKPTKVEPSKHN